MIDPATVVTWQGLREAIKQELHLFNGYLVAGQVFSWSDRPRQWIRTTGLKAGTTWFLEQVPLWGRLHELKGGPAVIVGQHYDTTIRHFTSPPCVGHWFGTQVAVRHPQLTAMPIGIDRRSVAPLQRAEQRKWEDRDILLYLNFRPHTDERKELYDRFRGMPGVVIDRWDRDDADHYARQLGRAKFVLSPPGFAWDCYRTYEALAMGAIPIVKNAGIITNTVNGLPVFVVNEWDEVTTDRLNVLGLKGRPFGCDQEPVLLQSYWVKQIAAKAQALLESTVAA